MSRWLPGDLVASDAQAAQVPSICALCPRRVVRGERIARLPNGVWAHVACTATMPHGGQENQR